MSPTLLLAIALAVSLAGNALLFRLHSAAIEDKGAALAAGAAWQASANTCTASVDKLAADGQARHDQLVAAIGNNTKRIRGLQQDAQAALSARPDNPADPCGSLERYLKAELQKERGLKQ